MDDELQHLTRQMDLGAGASRERLAEVGRQLGASFPPDYLAFMIATNGGEGPVGEDGYGAVYPIEELSKANRAYADFEHFEGLVIFGSDMGGEAFCFDAEGSVVMVEYISEREANVLIGSFADFMRRLGDGRLL